MNPIRFWFSVFSLLGVVVVAPAWMYFAGDGLTGVPTHINWLVALMFPVMMMLTIASWVQSWSGA